MHAKARRHKAPEQGNADREGDGDGDDDDDKPRDKDQRRFDCRLTSS